MSSGPDGSPPERRKRKWPWVALAAVLILAGSLALLLLYRAQVAERAAVRWLSGMGIEAKLTVESIGLASVRLRDVSVSDVGPSLDSAEITYSLRDLFEGRLGDLVLRGVQARARVGEQGIEVEGLPALGTADGAGPPGLPALPFEKAILEDFTVHVQTPAGPVEVSGDATVEPGEPGVIDFSGDIAAAGGPGSLKLSVSGQLVEIGGGALQVAADVAGAAEVQGAASRFVGALEATSRPSGTAEAVLSLEEATVSHDAGSVAGLVGEIRLGLAAGGLEWLDADLRLASARVAETDIEESRLRLSYENGRLDTVAEIRWEGGAVQAELAPAEAPGTFPYAVRLDGSLDAHWLSTLAATGVEATGRIGLTLAGRMVNPVELATAGAVTPATLLQAGSLDGQVVIDLGPSILPETVAVERIVGNLAFRLDEGRLDLRVEDEIRAGPVTAAPARLEALPPMVRELAGRPFSLSIGGGAIGGSGPAEATVRPDGPGAAAEATLDVVFAGSAGTMSATSTLRTGIDAGFGITDPEATRIALAVSDLSLAGVTTGGTAVVTDIATNGTVRGAVELDLSVSGRPTKDVRIEKGQLKAAGTFEFGDGRLSFLPAPGGRLGFARLEAGGMRTAKAVAVPFRAGEAGEPLVFDFSDGPSGNLRAGPLDLRLTGLLPEPAEVRVAVRSLTLGATKGAYRLAASGGTVGIPAHELALEGVAARATLGADGRFTGRIDAAEVKHLAAPPWFVPLKLALNIDGTVQRAAFSGELFEPARRLVLKARGNHSLATGRGTAALEAEPVVFIPTVLQPRQLFPAAYRLRIEADARIGGSAAVEWGQGALRSSGIMDVEITELSTSDLELKAVSAVLRLDSLAPLSSEPAQLVTIGEINLGLPLTDGIVRLELHPDGRVTGRIERFGLFGGWVRTEPFALDPRADSNHILLHVEGIDLAEFLAFAELGQLEATGTLRGTIPISVENGAVKIRDAALETAEEGGILKYRPEGVADALEQTNEATEVLMKALRDFRYSRVSVHMDETAADEMTFRLSLEGASPEVYQGLPLVLNINISGPLKDILSRGLRTYQLPGELGRQLQEGAR